MVTKNDKALVNSRELSEQEFQELENGILRLFNESYERPISSEVLQKRAKEALIELNAFKKAGGISAKEADPLLKALVASMVYIMFQEILKGIIDKPLPPHKVSSRRLLKSILSIA